MAEGWMRLLHGDLFEVFSAGLNPGRVDPLAIRVMAEAGVDISGNRSKHIDEFRQMSIDYVVTVCDNAREACPFFPARNKKIHMSFDDPPHLVNASSTPEEILDMYRRVRDEIRKFVTDLPESLTAQ
jgi:arsenate reductase (thioredoxin)